MIYTKRYSKDEVNNEENEIPDLYIVDPGYCVGL